MENKPLLKLSKKYIEYLENLPEQGMGYQIVDIKLLNGIKLIDRIVLNSTLLKLNKNNEFQNKDIKTIEIKLK